MAARPSGPTEARVPCPLCGGLIHPIAGRCKHCKADLGAQRSIRPAAGAALPSLAGMAKDGTAPPTRDATPVPSVLTAGAPATAVHEPDVVRAILPPRPTGRMQGEPRPGLLRHWPILVIVLAVIAIAVAIVVMVWPSSTSEAARSNTPAPPPAPERMDTNPLPPQGSITPPSPGQPGQPGPRDPWSDPNAGTQAPDDQTSIDPADPLADPLRNPSGGFGGANPLASILGGNSLVFTAFKHACNRMLNCGNSQLAVVCSQLDSLPIPSTLPSCSAAQRCIDHIDQLDCNLTLTSAPDILRLMTQAQDCVEATRC